MKRNHVFAPYLFGDAVNQVRVHDIERITHLNFAFMLIKDGKGDLSHLAPGVLDTVRSFKRINPDLKLIVSLGGWGAGGFSDACMTEEGREKLAASTVALAFAEGFDGVDVDWEYPCNGGAGIDYSPKDKQNFTLFLQCLRKHLDAAGEGHPLSIAVAAGEGYIENTEMDQVAEVCDLINIMTYDLRAAPTDLHTGHMTNLFYQCGDPASGPAAEHAVKIYQAAGVPVEKMVLGCAFYGRGWYRCNTWENNGLGVKGEPMVGVPGGAGYDNLKANYINKNGFVRFWDDKAKAPYLYNGDMFISYDDPDSIREKCKFAMDKGLAGVMYWAYGSHDLFEAIAENLE